MTASIKNIKNTRKDYLVDELTIKLEQKDHSNASHCFEPVNFSNHRLEQRIVATSKTIVYLFSPDIDLLENIESNIQNYDKYQKTKFLLRDLLSDLGRNELEIEVIKTSEEIERLQQEIEELSIAFQHLDVSNKEKDQQIGRYRNSIIELSKAYEEAKIYYTDEILEYKYAIEELKCNLDQMEKKQRSKSKLKSKYKSKKVTLNVPQDLNHKQNEAYTDRSIYKRFSTSQIASEDETNPNKSCNPLEINVFSANRHLLDKHQIQKENLQRKIVELELKLAKVEEQRSTLRKESQKEIKELTKKVLFLESQLKTKTSKLKQKNKTICQLLDSFQGKIK